ncbi:hypothetical protein RUR49_19060 [Pseudoxanthobacter sp. M-2]|uniref:hypothetical protein n=1 Tax=Pseudoxanthobacter sp. M-2 TaxID=3078754 RepID=UPI0038FCD52B
MKTDDEIEALRLRLLKGIEDDWAATGEKRTAFPALMAEFAPGTAGAHEAMHTAFIVREMLADHLAGHAAVIANPAWFRQAARAGEAIDALLQAIRAAHAIAAAEAEQPAAKPAGPSFGGKKAVPLGKALGN